MKNLRDYIKYHQGNIPLIISVPHGGSLKVQSIPMRSNGIIGMDKKTIELSISLVDKIKKHFDNKNSSNKSPSYIISKVHRSKIDINKIETDAYCHSSKLAKEIYGFYHEIIKKYIIYNMEHFNYSILIDIHGFEKNKIPKGFRDVDIILGTDNLKTISRDIIPRRLWKQNLRGKIIKKFLDLDIIIAPGHPMRSEYVLTGGYITKEYGANKINNSQTIQIEFSDKIRIWDNRIKNTVLCALAEVLCKDLTNI
jgi:hypothetical protein